MSIETVEFSNIKLWGCHEVPAPARENSKIKEIPKCMMQTAGDKCLSYSVLKKWSANFQHDLKAQVAIWSERHSVVLTFGITDHSWPKFGQSTNPR